MVVVLLCLCVVVVVVVVVVVERGPDSHPGRCNTWVLQHLGVALAGRPAGDRTEDRGQDTGDR